MELAYSHESEPRGTGDAVALAMQLLTGNEFFVRNGDTRLRLGYARFAGFARTAGARLGVALSQVPDVSRYGAVRVAQDRITGFVEKGKSGPGYINAGVYWMDLSLQSAFPSATSFSFEADVPVPAVARERVVAFIETDGFIDIGVPEDYRRAQTLFAAAGVAS